MAKKKSSKKSGIIAIIIIIFLFIFAVGFSVAYRISKRVPANPAGTVGNSAGNLYNKALFCESGDKIFFANSYDYDSLYSMNKDGTNLKKLISAKVEYINVGGDYIYYYMADSSTDSDDAKGLGFLRRVMGIYRCKKNGKGAVTLSRDPSLTLVLVDNSLYYQDYDRNAGVRLSKMSINGTDIKVVSPQIISPAGVYDDTIYFMNPENNHHLMILDTKQDTIVEYKSINMMNPIRLGNYIYFLNIDGDYNLCRYSIDSDSIEVITKDRVDCYNLNTEYIFYQKNDANKPCLKRIAIDGMTEEVVAEGNFTNINMTGNYVYFQPFDQMFMTYRTPAYGSINVTEFEEAKTAAFSD
ncbi:MAG: DUF5050 domain-containing protein [Lachnospiraceae bacterium]|nr:DUF5050 domain-containing protein [Lachnospiraceae bacterium]MBP5564114.1 DUF5050 domain-containing protein [Lachnospiraceae bacterium]